MHGIGLHREDAAAKLTEVNRRNVLSVVAVLALGLVADSQASDAQVSNAQDDPADALIRAVRDQDAPKVAGLLKASRDSRQTRAYPQSALDLALLNASIAGSLPITRLLIDAGANPNPSEGFTPLMAASGDCLPDLVAEFLKHKPNVNARDYSGRTALSVIGQARLDGPMEDCAAVTRMFLDRGADPNVRDLIYGNTPLHEVPDAKTAKLLINAGTNVDVRNSDGETALMLTLDDDVTQVLLDAGANLAIQNNAGKTALQIARDFGLREKAALIEKAAAARRQR